MKSDKGFCRKIRASASLMKISTVSHVLRKDVNDILFVVPIFLKDLDKVRCKTWLMSVSSSGCRGKLCAGSYSVPNGANNFLSVLPTFLSAFG